MKIGIDIINSNERLGGVDRYAIELISHLALIDNLNTYYIFYAPWQRYIIQLLKIKDANFHLIELSLPKNRFLRSLWRLFFLQKKMKPFSLHVVHHTNPVPLSFMKCYTLLTVHDMAEFVLSEKYGRLNSYLKRWIAQLSIKRSDIIITVSEYSKKVIVNMLHIDDAKVKVIPEGVCMERFNPGDCNDILRKYKLPPNYILFVGGIKKGKNVELIMSAFAKLNGKLKDSYFIVIVGKRGNAYGDIVKMIKLLQMEGKVIFLDHIPDEVLPCIYKHARAFVFPSLIEGFGLPVLEAMACGVPVISSNTTSLPEVCGDSAILLDPSNIEDYKNAIETVLTNDAYRKDLIHKGKMRVLQMSWYVTAEKTLNEYYKIVKRRMEC